MFRLGFALITALIVAPFGMMAQGIVWSGPSVTFSNAPGSDPLNPANADHITSSVWLTRSASAGLFNYFEGSFTKISSPSGTLWALGNLSDYASLNYTNWTACYGGAGVLASTIVGTNAVVHLIAEDIYLSVRFTYWGGPGGGFAYVRSSPASVPEPAATAIVALGIAGLVWKRRRGR